MFDETIYVSWWWLVAARSRDRRSGRYADRMTPVPKNLSPQQRLAWRRAMARGTSPYTAAKLAAGKYGYRRDGTDANSLDRATRGVSES